MWYFGWFVTGIIMSIITLYVRKHTYEYTSGKKYTFPLIGIIGLLILFFIPIVGVVAFIYGGKTYLVNCCNDEIRFKPTRVVKKISNFLSKEI